MKRGQQPASGLVPPGTTSPVSHGYEAMTLGTGPLTPWHGLGVLAVWAACALLAGGVLLAVRGA